MELHSQMRRTSSAIPASAFAVFASE